MMLFKEMLYSPSFSQAAGQRNKEVGRARQGCFYDLNLKFDLQKELIAEIEEAESTDKVIMNFKRVKGQEGKVVPIHTCAGSGKVPPTCLSR